MIMSRYNYRAPAPARSLAARSHAEAASRATGSHPSFSLFSSCCAGGLSGESDLKFNEKLNLQILFQLPHLVSA